MEKVEIEKGVPLPTDPDWIGVLSFMEKGDSFIVGISENILAVYKAAEETQLTITHRQVSKKHIRIWRIN